MASRKDMQELQPRVETWIFEKQVEIIYVVNPRRGGTMAPEFNHIFLLDGRKIQPKAMAFMITADLFAAGYTFTISHVMPVLMKFTWEHYKATQPYEDWLKYDGMSVPKRKPGRPRTKPQRVAINN